MASNDSQILGVVLLVRNGDRLGLYQDPTTYSASATQITPLGNEQEFQLGGLLRSIYLNSSSPSYISGMSTGLFDQSQVSIKADLGDGSGVIYDSCVSLTQGLWPATLDNNITLANGSMIVAPNGGYQNVPINSVDPNLDVSLEGYWQCNTLDFSTHFFYHSRSFRQMANQSAAFLALLPPYLGGRQVSLGNIWDVFDYMNVNSIHNATFAQALPPTFLPQARYLADWHEYNVLNDRHAFGIGSIAGQTLLPSILTAFNNIIDPANSIKMTITAISYKPFLSLFSMMGVASANPQLAGIVDYASAVALEVRQPSTGGGPVIRFNFKNGTADFATYDFLGQTGDVPLSAFVNVLSPNTVNTTAEWCNICQNTLDRGCDALALAAQQARSAVVSSVGPISPVGAGFLGAGLTLIAIIMALATLALFRRVRRPKTGRAAMIDDGVLLRKRESKRDSLVTLVQ